MSEVHNGPTGLHRVASGAGGTGIAAVLLYFAIDEWHWINDPDPVMRDLMVGAIVALWGGAWSRWLGQFSGALAERALRWARGGRAPVVLLAALLLAGCASTGAGSFNAGQLAIQYATLKVIDRNPEKAARVHALANEALTWTMAGEYAALDELEARVRTRIVEEANPDPADMLLIDALLAATRAELEARIGDGVLDEATRVRVNEVLGWIIAATAPYA